jgi:hypothetical protein
MKLKEFQIEYGALGRELYSRPDLTSKGRQYNCRPNCFQY